MKLSATKVRKTYKLFISGAFARSESGRTLAANAPGGIVLDRYSWASRKDFKDAVVAARTCLDDWSRRTPYLRGQILYRAAEMAQQRELELAREIARSTGIRPAAARREISGCVDRLVHYAGWADKFAAVFSSTNPVASAHFNFTVPEPSGVVAIIAPDQPSLLALVSLVSAVILSGNTAVVLVSEKNPLPALTFAEVIANSDIPPGVVNLLAGRRLELAPHFASHMDINAIIDASNDSRTSAVLGIGQSSNLKRYVRRQMSDADWYSQKAENPYWILDTTEYKTAWHPIGI